MCEIGHVSPGKKTTAGRDGATLRRSALPGNLPRPEATSNSAAAPRCLRNDDPLAYFARSVTLLALFVSAATAIFAVLWFIAPYRAGKRLKFSCAVASLAPGTFIETISLAIAARVRHLENPFSVRVSAVANVATHAFGFRCQNTILLSRNLSCAVMIRQTSAEGACGVVRSCPQGMNAPLSSA